MRSTVKDEKKSRPPLTFSALTSSKQSIFKNIIAQFTDTPTLAAISRLNKEGRANTLTELKERQILEPIKVIALEKNRERYTANNPELTLIPFPEEQIIHDILNTKAPADVRHQVLVNIINAPLERYLHILLDCAQRGKVQAHQARFPLTLKYLFNSPFTRSKLSVECNRTLEKIQKELIINLRVTSAVDSRDEKDISMLIPNLKKIGGVAACDNQGRTMLMLYAGLSVEGQVLSLDDELKEMQTLIHQGANVNAHDKKMRTPLSFSINFFSYEKTKLLLDNKAQPNARDDAGNTTLMLAVKTSQPRLVALLERRGADINLANNAGETALMFALETLTKLHTVERPDQLICTKAEAILTYLLEHHADVSAKTLTGKTVFDFAKGNHERINQLKKYQTIKNHFSSCTIL
jgi:hypothetical protein